MFWSIVIATVVVVLVIAWRFDRKHPGTRVSRRVGAAETDFARGAATSGQWTRTMPPVDNGDNPPGH
ncbi:MAG TPA: hypothetical protein VJ872_01630 [Nocardioides sp.]|nr:hypothetical protein [Nocardioides sp.]